MATGSVRRIVSASGRIVYRACWDAGSAGNRRQRYRSFPVPPNASPRDEAAIRKRAERYAWEQVNGEPAVGRDAGRITVGELLRRWYDGPVAGREPSTRATYAFHIRCHLLPAFGDIRAADLEPLMVEDWLRAKEARYSRRYCGMMLTVLRAALRQGMAWRVARFDPTAGVRLAGRPEKSGRSLSEAEARRLLVAADASPDRGLWRLLLLGGLRVGEVAALTWGDVVDKPSEAGVWVRRTASRDESSRRTVKDGAKGGRERFVPLDGETVRALGERQFPAVFVFRSQRSAHLSSDAVRWRLTKLLTVANVAQATPHDLRRSQVTLLRQAGVPPDVAAAIAGHSVAMADAHYRRVSDEEKRAAVDQLATRLKG